MTNIGYNIDKTVAWKEQKSVKSEGDYFLGELLGLPSDYDIRNRRHNTPHGHI